MGNEKLILHLDKIADFYIFATDPVRSKSFRSLARKVETLLLEISNNNIDTIKLPGLGESTLEVIKQFIDKGKSTRHEELSQKFPPKEALDLLSLYNFDIEYVVYLWQTYRVFSLKDLQQVDEDRVKIARSHPKSSHSIESEPHEYNILGDFIISNYSSGNASSIESMVSRLKNMGDKHIFISDYIASPNISYGVLPTRVESLGRVIKELQIKFDVKIFHGFIVDLDLDGRIICPPAILVRTEYIILKLATQPHFNIIERLSAAIESLSNRDNIIIDILDSYCNLISASVLNDFIVKYQPIVMMTRDASNSIVLEYLKHVSLNRIALGSYAEDSGGLQGIHQAASAAIFLQTPASTLINCLPRPFKKEVQVQTKVGTKNTLDFQDRTLEKIEKLRAVEPFDRKNK